MLLNVLKAKEGYVLTQVKDVPKSVRVFASYIMLKKGESPDNYKEISIEDAKKLYDVNL